MKRGIVGLCCIFFLLLSACGTDADVILQTEEGEEATDSADRTTDEAADSADRTTTEASDSADEAADSADEAAGAASGEGSGPGASAGVDGGNDAAADTGEALSGVKAAEESAGICVYICGAVASPGVYRLPDGGRVYELVEMAGGLLPDADERSVNLAQALDDGAMVYIPTEEESEAGVDAGTYTTAAAAGTTAGTDAGEAKVNINTADAEALTALNGIGEAKAAAIVAYREEHGAFQSLEEIMEVSGIGEGTYDKIKDDITL